MEKRSRPRRASTFYHGVAMAGVAIALGLGGCADLRRVTSVGEEGVNVESPTAPLALAASHAKFPYPSFRQLPPTPSDMRPAAAFKVAVGEQRQAGEGVDAWVQANPSTTSGGEAFAQTLRRKVVEPGATPVVDRSAEAAAFAQRLRDASRPPPPLTSPP